MISTTGEGQIQRTAVGHFSRSSLPGFAPPNTNKEFNLDKRDKKKLIKRSSLFSLGSSASSDALEGGGAIPPNGDRTRPHVKGRPSSLFGSLGRRSTNPMLEISKYPESPFDSTDDVKGSEPNGTARVLHHGEVQTTSGLFRKKKEYLVLTETHLIRFRSQSRASDAFQSIPPASGRSSTRHPSTTSIGSLQEIQSLSSRSSAENDNATPLHQIVAAYKVDDGRLFYSIEVVYLDEELNIAGSVQLMLQDPREAELWHTSIRGAAQKARLLAVRPYPDRIIQHLVQILESAQDYDETHFKLFRVVRRAAAKYSGRSSSDELNKLGSTVFYLVIGLNLIHLIPVPDLGGNPSRPVDTKAQYSSFGLVSLVAMEVQHTDDGFELCFRNPLQAPIVLDLAASSPPEIATAIFQSIIYAKPQWLDHTFLFAGPSGVLKEPDSADPFLDDNGSFDRTLIAYCSAYHCDPRNVRYTIDLAIEDGPEFRLVAPANFMTYSVFELLAIFRALRYTESFRSISFQGVDLQCLHGLVDPHGVDHVAWTSRSGLDIRKYFNIMPEGRSLLYQEVQGLALKTNRVRRMNFGDTLPKRRPRDVYEEEGAPKDPGCEIAAALFPVCRARLTNVDWIVLSGIELGETDLEELTPALDERLSHFRCVDVSRCGLTDRGMQVFLNHLEMQNATMECINISDNPGRLHLGRFPITMSRFSQIRKLDLSRATSTSGNEPLIAIEVMLAWRLEELVLTGVPINDKTLDSLSTYVASDVSNSLRYLEMDQCNLTGTSVATLLRSMSRAPGQARELNFHVSANRLEKGNSEIVKAIEENVTSSHLTMRMVEYQTESRFRELLQALRHNTTIKCLDISKASLPYDAGDETCEALQNLFEDNVTLEELNISGEHAHLEVARFGIGLSHALTGLRKNRALKVLKIEYQNLGLEGANTLCSVLEENETLTNIYCEHNDINLQGFTILVNAIARNFTILSMPLMLDDQVEAVKRMKGAINLTATSKTETGTGVLKHSVRKTLTSLGVHIKETPIPTAQDIEQAVSILNARWARQTQRLTGFLERNMRIALGIDTVDMYNGDGGAGMRPATVWSDSGIMEQVLATGMSGYDARNSLDNIDLKTDDVEDNPRVGNAAYEVAGGRSRSVSQLTAKIKTFELSDESLLEEKDIGSG